MSTFNPTPFAQAAFKEVQKTLQASIIKANVEILERVAGDYDLDFDDMINRYGLAVASIDLIVPVAPKRKPTAGEPKAPCSAINAKKRPCKRVAMPGCAMCKLHSRQAAEQGGQTEATEPQARAEAEAETGKLERPEAEQARTEADSGQVSEQARTEADSGQVSEQARTEDRPTEPLDFDEMYPEELQLELSDEDEFI